MEKDFTNVRYLKFSAIDDYEAEFIDVVIDLVTDCIISGVIKIGEEDEDRLTINVPKDLDKLPNAEYSIFAKVVDTGSYYLLDEDKNVLFKSVDYYVPSLMDYYNGEPGFGDCIDLYIEDIKTGKLKHHGSNKISYNNHDDWKEVDEAENLYHKGMMDAFNIIYKILTSHDDYKVTNAINVINNFKNNNNYKA